MSIGIPVIVIVGFFMVMANFKHADGLSWEEVNSIEMYQNLAEQTKKSSEIDISKEDSITKALEVNALTQVFSNGESIANGASGEVVKVLQQFLDLDADGHFGSETEAAVKEFQHENGYIVDGIVDGSTLNAFLDLITDSEEVATGNDFVQ